MSKSEKEDKIEKLVKKGDAARFFGFSATAGYRYIDYLVAEGILSPRFLPGVRTPRFFMGDLQSIANNSANAEVSANFDVKKKTSK